MSTKKRKRKKKQGVNRESVRRIQHSIIAFLVAVVLMIVVIAVAFGSRIKAALDSGEGMGVNFFLAVLYPEKYSYSAETVDLNEYFKIFASDDVAIILQDTLLDGKAKYYDDNVYFSLAMTENLFTDRFYYNEAEKEVLYSKSDSVIRVYPELMEKCYYIEKEGDTETVELGYVPARIENGELYLAADYIRLFADFEYHYFPAPHRVQVYTQWDVQRVATLKEDTKLREKGGIKSEILCPVAKGDEVVLLEAMENWSKVKTEDGFIGYVENKRLNEAGEITPTPATGAYIPEMDYAMEPPIDRVLMGFHQIGNADGGDGLNSLVKNATGLNVVCPTWYFLKGPDGSYNSLASSQYVKNAHAKGYQVWALVEDMSHSFDEYTLFSVSANRKNLIDKLMKEAETYGFDGFNIDLEMIDSKTGPHYIQFLRELSIRTHAAGLVLSVDDYVPNAGNTYLNMAEQGLVSDYVVMMGYDEHWAGSDAGSVASIGFVEKGIEDNLTLGVPVQKLIVGVPFYTRIWKTEGGTVTSEAVGMDVAAAWVEKRSITPVWDEETCQNYAEYVKDGATYQVWLEDKASMEARLSVIARAGVRSVAGWKLGMESKGIWEDINTSIK